MLTIAKKEITDALKNKLFLIIMGMLLSLILISVILGALQVEANVDSYTQAVELLKSIGKTNLPPAPKYNPLSSSKSYTNYIGLLGALLAIVLGNLSIVKERQNGTMRLILSRKIGRNSFLNGKILGNLVLLFCTSLGGLIITLVTVLSVSSVSITGDDVVRLCFFFFVSFLYMTFFLLLAVFMSIHLHGGNKALLITVIIWLVISFVFPQIGDTMDMDNQIPGGFFASMGMNKEESKKVLADFRFYETLRDGIEELSPTKHYERAGFALLNVKPGFEENTALEVIVIKWFDIFGLLAPSIVLTLGSYMIILRREDIYEE